MALSKAGRYLATMDDAAIADLIERVDKATQDAPREVGVAMGAKLYEAVCDRGLVSMETFSVLGSGFLPHSLPAYRGTRFVYVPPHFPEWSFLIGKYQNA